MGGSGSLVCVGIGMTLGSHITPLARSYIETSDVVFTGLSDGVVERCHLRDASWFQWPLLEVAIEGNIVADFPLCNKSFNCSYSGHDL